MPIDCEPWPGNTNAVFKIDPPRPVTAADYMHARRCAGASGIRALVGPDDAGDARRKTACCAPVARAGNPRPVSGVWYHATVTGASRRAPATESCMVPVPRSDSGFTLIEIMVVMVIIAILGALIGPQILGRVDEARVTKAQADIRTLGTSLDLYRMDNFQYPTTAQGLQALVTRPDDPSVRNWKTGGYVQKLTKDPWGNEYQYSFPGTRGGAYDLYSLGADGQPGGEDTATDVGNWNTD
jgi:general secretion pathway protein G